MALSKGANCVRVFLVVFNIIFLLLGAATLALGLFVIFGGEVLNDFLQPLLNPIGADKLPIGEIFRNVAYVIVGLGALMLILGFLGCCGACIKSVCMIDSYAGIVSLLLLVEIAVVVVFFVIEEEVDTQLKDWMNVTLVNDFSGFPMNDSVDTESVMKTMNTYSLAWSFVHNYFQCCGINNYTDTYYAVNWNRTIDETFAASLGLPSAFFGVVSSTNATVNSTLVTTTSSALLNQTTTTIYPNQTTTTIHPNQTLDSTLQPNSTQPPNSRQQPNSTQPSQTLILTPSQPLSLALPISCCKTKGTFPNFEPVDISCVIAPNTTNANIELGCYEAIKNELKSQSNLLLGIGITVAVFEVAVIAISCYLCSAFNNEKKKVTPRPEENKKPEVEKEPRPPEKHKPDVEKEPPTKPSKPSQGKLPAAKAKRKTKWDAY